MTVGLSRSDAPFFSVIVPVLDGGGVFGRCLNALKASEFLDWELIVVDDGSEDGSDLLAEQMGARLLRTAGRQGPGAARNLGAAEARGRFLLFVDADCEVRPETLSLASAHLDGEDSPAALFGSYDDEPVARTLVSRYKNLQHHFVHQNAKQEASTFWAGCGAVRRTVFLELGGFDVEQYQRPCIEDIELGYRLRTAGYRIKLAKDVQVKHHKRWTLRSLVKTDVMDRAIPWTMLLMANHRIPNDLNLDIKGKVSVIAIVTMLASLVLALLDWRLLWLAAGLGALLLAVNLDIYRFFFRRGGFGFALGCVALHWLYFLYSAFAFVAGNFLVLVGRPRRRLKETEG